MRHVGIIVPTTIEAEILIKSISERTETVVQNCIFYGGVVRGRPVVLCVCGIGKTSAAHGTTLLIERFNPTTICLVGVAGAYPSSGLRIGESVMAEKEIYGDEGLNLGTGFRGMAEIGLPLAVANGKPYYNEFPMHVPDELKGFDKKGVFVTVSACTGTMKLGRDIEHRYSAVCENMEGAAVAHVCLLNSMPAVEVRGVSNIIEDREGRPLDRIAILKAAENVQEIFLETFLS